MCSEAAEAEQVPDAGFVFWESPALGGSDLSCWARRCPAAPGGAQGPGACPHPGLGLAGEVERGYEQGRSSCSSSWSFSLGAGSSFTPPLRAGGEKQGEVPAMPGSKDFLCPATGGCVPALHEILVTGWVIEVKRLLCIYHHHISASSK